VANELQGKKIAILLAPVGTEQVEFEESKKAVESEDKALLGCHSRAWRLRKSDARCAH
jgi:hypothetical protein